MTGLAMIFAVAENGVIGRDNGLPWHLPGDLRHFKALTMGKPVIMGRKTFESIGRALPGRSNIIISRNPAFRGAGVTVVLSLEDALVLASSVADKDGTSEAVVIGGAEIYAAAADRADRLYVTEVHAPVEGDAYLRPLDWAQWREVSRERHAAGNNNPYDYSFVQYERKRVTGAPDQR